MTADASYGQTPPGRSRKQALPRDVYSALATDDDARSMVLGAFRAMSGNLNTWGRSDREAMATALTRAEDAVELRRASPARDALGLALRGVRRRLETELWP